MKLSKYAFLLAAAVTTGAHAGMGRTPAPEAEPTPAFDPAVCELAPGNFETSVSVITCHNEDGSKTKYPMKEDLQITSFSNLSTDPEISVVGYGVQDRNVTFFIDNADNTYIDQLPCDFIVPAAAIFQELGPQATIAALTDTLVPDALEVTGGDVDLASHIAANQAIGLSSIYMNAAEQCRADQSPEATPDAKDAPSKVVPMQFQQTPVYYGYPGPGVVM